MSHQAFDPTQDHRISRREAAELVLNFQAKQESGIHFASAFNRSAFEQLLAQPGAVGIRIYRAEHADGSPTMVMVAVDETGTDMEGTDNLFMQNSSDCPPFCKSAKLSKS